MIIQHNLPAINANRTLGVTNRQTAGNLEKLSSGFRINRAADDAAGLAISEKMRGQIRGLSMAEMNVSHGINLIQTAEGGMNEIHAVLQRQRELAVQSSNGTYHDKVDRENLQKEFQALKDEIDRIAKSTHYNGINLLNGGQDTMEVEPPFLVTNPPPSIVTSIPDSLEIGAGENSKILYIDMEHALAQSPGAAMIASILLDFSNPSGVFDGPLSITITDPLGKDYLINIKTDTFPGSGIKEGIDGFGYIECGSTGTAYGETLLAFAIGESINHYMLSDSEKYNTHTGRWYISINNQSSETLNVNFEAASGYYNESGPITSYGVLNIGKVIKSTEESSEIWIQAGANAGEGINVDIYDCRTDTLGIGGINISTRDLANNAISFLDNAINTVSGYRATAGAQQNRLEHTLNNLGVSKENLQAAESTIRDVDMAKEMMEFTKNNILAQAAQSIRDWRVRSAAGSF